MNLGLVGHSTLNIRDNILIFGGWTGKEYSNKLILIDLKKGKVKY
jgi:hypothetical protein